MAHAGAPERIELKATDQRRRVSCREVGGPRDGHRLPLLADPPAQPRPVDNTRRLGPTLWAHGPAPSAILGRQAHGDRSRPNSGHRPPPGVQKASRRAQLICLPMYVDAELVSRVRYSWHALSEACHYPSLRTAARRIGTQRPARRRRGTHQGGQTSRLIEGGNVDVPGCALLIHVVPKPGTHLKPCSGGRHDLALPTSCRHAGHKSVPWSWLDRAVLHCRAGRKLSAACRLARYSVKACLPASVACAQVRGLEPTNSFVMDR